MGGFSINRAASPIAHVMYAFIVLHLLFFYIPISRMIGTYNFIPGICSIFSQGNSLIALQFWRYGHIYFSERIDAGTTISKDNCKQDLNSDPHGSGVIY